MSHRKNDAAKGRTGWAGLLLGAVLTTAWFGGLYAAGFAEWQGVQELALNELGDFLGGVVAPVAFLWLVIGYFQQAAALQLQQREIHLAIEEMRVLGEHAGRQTDALEREDRLRRRFIQPRFEVNAGGASHPEGGWQRRSVVFHNHGGRAEDVKIEGWGTVLRRVASVKQDGSIRLELSDQNVRRDFELRVRFEDAAGARWTQWVHVRESGEPMVTKPEPLEGE